jgi:putative ABC transport system permease protein
MSRTLDRKVWRELVHLRGQMLAIMLVLACGIAAFVTMISNRQALDRSRVRYYESNRLADLFAQVVRAPQSIEARIRELPGVATVETRLVWNVNVDVEHFDEPIIGKLISIDPTIEEGSRLNELVIRKGRLPRVDRNEEIAVLEGFAAAHGLEPGDEIEATINGSKQRLQIVGVVISPEYVYVIPPGSAFPDPARYAILWANRSMLAAAFDMESAFNDVVLTTTAGADERDLRARLDLLLAPYGGLDSYGRDLQLSNRMLSMELEGLRSSGLFVPLIFLGVAAFLLNVVLSRVISTQREQIAALKAVGYGNVEVGLHYAKIVSVVLAAGTGLGIALGAWLGRGLSNLYLDFFSFPSVAYRLEPSLLLGSVGVAVLAGGLGTFNAVRKVVALPPAEAMRPAAPSIHGRSLLDRFGMIRLFGPPGRMVLRNLAQRPGRALLTSLGISMAVAILVTGNFSKDSIDHLIHVQFGLAQRYDLQVGFNSAVDESAVRELEHMPGVLVAEPFRAAPARLRNGHRSYQTAIQGIPANSELRRLLDAELRIQRVPEAGVVLTSNLAERLELQVGDSVTVEVLEETRPTRDMVVSAIVDEIVGISAYMDNRALNRFLREGPRVSGAWLLVDPAQVETLNEQLEDTPGVASVSSLRSMLQAFLDTSEEMQATSRTILLLFASVIAVGVVYNSARITLSERARELASLRVMGFTKAEVSTILLGEFAILLIAAIPIGWVLGYYLAVVALSSVDSDLYRFPVVIQAGTYAFAALVVIVAGVATALLVRRRINHLDLVSVLKTRE